MWGTRMVFGEMGPPRGFEVKFGVWIFRTSKKLAFCQEIVRKIARREVQILRLSNCDDYARFRHHVRYVLRCS